METAIDSSVGIVAYLALFGGVGFVFVFVNLLVGRFLRPSNPNEEKLEIYECGEPAIGSSFVQFDLRFYVVALVFIIFDVEVAFLFPWATVYGKVTHVAGVLDPGVRSQFGSFDSGSGDDDAASDSTRPAALPPVSGELVTLPEGSSQPEWTAEALAMYREMGVRDPQIPPIASTSVGTANQLLMYGDMKQNFAGFAQILFVAALAISFFFVVLLVGFAYEWRTGALDWVRSVSNSPPASLEREAPRSSSPQESVLSA